MATRREPSAADTDGAITNATFLHNEIYFHPGLQVSYHSKKSDLEDMCSIFIRRFI